MVWKLSGHKNVGWGIREVGREEVAAENLEWRHVSQRATF